MSWLTGMLGGLGGALGGIGSGISNAFTGLLGGGGGGMASMAPAAGRSGSFTMPTGAGAMPSFNAGLGTAPAAGRSGLVNLAGMGANPNFNQGAAGTDWNKIMGGLSKEVEKFNKGQDQKYGAPPSPSPAPLGGGGGSIIPLPVSFEIAQSQQPLGTLASARRQSLPARIMVPQTLPLPATPAPANPISSISAALMGMR